LNSCEIIYLAEIRTLSNLRIRKLLRMKKILLFIIFAIGLSSSNNLLAQGFTVADTVWQTVNGSATVMGPVTNKEDSTITLKWSVLSTSFPADWLTETAFSICDDEFCRSNASGALWNGTGGNTYHPLYYSNASKDSVGDFHLLLNLTGLSSGSHYVTVRFSHTPTGTSTTETFVINKWPTAVSNVNNADNNIVLYPNPAHDEVNVVYDENADIKNIAVYNIIGKVMAVYKVTNNTSANLNLENIPSGIYFVRLINSHGDVVVTRKFTKQ